MMTEENMIFRGKNGKATFQKSLKSGGKKGKGKVPKVLEENLFNLGNRYRDYDLGSLANKTAAPIALFCDGSMQNSFAIFLPK